MNYSEESLTATLSDIPRQSGRTSFVFGFLLAGYLTAQIMQKNRVLGISMILLHMTSNILSVVPFVPGHYPYFQWKLPQWIYRLVTGDPISEIVTNFIRIPPL